MNKLCSVVISSLFLSACGGGSSEAPSTVSPPVAVTTQTAQVVSTSVQSYPATTELSLVENNPSSVKTSSEIIVSTAAASREIAVPNNFPLNSERLLTLRISLSKNDSQPAYLSLCTDYNHQSDGSYRINYNSCLLRTSLNNANFESKISVTNDTKGLVAAIWFMDKNKSPLIKDWRF